MTTRSKKSKNMTLNSPVKSCKRIENSWLLVLKKSVKDNNNFTIVTLPHPVTGNPAKYCLDDEHNKIYEVVTFSEPYRSWLIGETVKSDGSLLMVTPVNPLFLVLPRLREQCSTRAVPLEHVLSEKGYDKITDFVTNLDLIGDLKGPADMKAYKYNEEKTLTWLETRVRKLSKVLRDKNINVTSGAVSATFVTSNIDSDTVDEEFYLRYAHGMVSEYLQDDLAEHLENRFNFKPDLIEAVGKKRKSEAADMIDVNKKFKCESQNISDIENVLNNSNSSFTEIKKPKILSAKEKARQKAASGTKTISSFFTKK
ncbi:ribonuclease H2 subunit B [Plodia interpunctella]|uniref:ribonuclease H2 subunit B n=1 Tax=Plodia interpunctella TaxID=58824 RepID=UPI002368BB27|nr:ribonuclease H2 subunit B [Plodia interpunctella]XP_053600843.1 ribonuclease H2 subunit B [Plodia interpunctella]